MPGKTALTNWYLDFIPDSVGQQLPLDIALRDEATLERFLTGPNGELVHLLSGLDPAARQMIMISGVQGSGKTHLLQAVSRRINGAVYLPLATLPQLSAGMLDGLAARAVVCLDDIHVISTNAEMELALFGLINEIKDNEHSCIFTSRYPLQKSGFQLQDLVSRLNACVQYALELPDDEQKMFFLQEDARRRGLQLGEEVISWLMTHMARDMPSLAEFLAVLDQESLSRQRKITIPFAREVLSRQTR